MRLAPVVAAVAVLAGHPARGAAEEARLPLPDAPVRLVIPDAPAFDAALAGSFRRAAVGEIDAADPLVASWRQSPVGSKLEAEWSKLAGDLPWTWAEILRLQPRSLGLALLSVGSLEAVLAIDTALATLPLELPAGEARTHAGLAYALVARGAGDASAGDERRMGLAWARHRGILLVATSERALQLALDESAAGRGVGAFLPGLASLELDLERLRKDRYFVREFRFGAADEGRVRAALRLEGGRIVEVREGEAGDPATALTFDAAGAAAAGWETEKEGLWRALRAGLLEPTTALSERPVPPLAPLPPIESGVSDRYLVNLERPPVEASSPWEEGDLATWRGILAERPAPAWGWRIDRGAGRALVFAWPEARQADLERACRATLERRAGKVGTLRVGEAVELRVGPELPALALRRTGGFVWVASSAAALVNVAAPSPEPGLARWARLDLEAVRAEADRWARAEGPAAPERVRPFSDRVLGLLGWVPSVRALSVERRQSGPKWSERVVFETR
jgi:hypothetical protein